MSYTESEDVAANLAADFRDAMEDITTNSKYEIQNLTLIARENTEHALAISGAIMEHIKRVGHQIFLFPSLVAKKFISNNALRGMDGKLSVSTIHHQHQHHHSYTLNCIDYIKLQASPVTNHLSLDHTAEKAARHLCHRLDRKKCRNPVHVILRPEALPYIHGHLREGRQCYAEEDGRDAEDMETTDSRLDGPSACIPSRRRPPYRERLDHGEDQRPAGAAGTGQEPAAASWSWQTWRNASPGRAPSRRTYTPEWAATSPDKRFSLPWSSGYPDCERPAIWHPNSTVGSSAPTLSRE